MSQPALAPPEIDHDAEDVEALRRLIAIGMALADAISTHAVPHAIASDSNAIHSTTPDSDAPDSATHPAPPEHRDLAFERVALAVRRTILLKRHIIEGATADASHKPKPKLDDNQRTAARTRVIRDVEDAVSLQHGRSEHAETLRLELVERLDAPDFDADLAARPVADIIQDLRRDLGLAGARFCRRTPEIAAALAALAAAPPGRTLERLATMTPPEPVPDRPHDPAAPHPAHGRRVDQDEPDLTALDRARYRFPVRDG